MRKSKINSDIIYKKALILEDIKKTRQALETAYSKFQYVSDPDLIDCYIYEINSADHRYKYLINQMRQLTISEAAGQSQSVS